MRNYRIAHEVHGHRPTENVGKLHSNTQYKFNSVKWTNKNHRFATIHTRCPMYGTNTHAGYDASWSQKIIAINNNYNNNLPRLCAPCECVCAFCSFQLKFCGNHDSPIEKLVVWLGEYDEMLWRCNGRPPLSAVKTAQCTDIYCLRKFDQIPINVRFRWWAEWAEND